MASTPTTSKELRQKVYEGPQITFTASSKPDFSGPHFAWLFGSMKDGTWLRDILKGEDIKFFDPTFGFNRLFPPVAFVNGDRDFHVPVRFGERAHREWIAMGMGSMFHKVEGQGISLMLS